MPKWASLHHDLEQLPQTSLVNGRRNGQLLQVTVPEAH